MQVSELSPKTSYISSRGKKIPRYLYHMTSKKNYESMLKDGFIKTGHDAYLDSNLDGIFMFDLKNFIKRAGKGNNKFIKRLGGRVFNNYSFKY